MTLVIVPNDLSDAIEKAIDDVLAGRPATEDDRYCIRQKILAYYDVHGAIPSFELKEAKADA